MTSIFKRVLQRFVRPTCFVGRDLEGNRYYEYPNANDGRPKRTVQYQQSDDMWAYVASGKRLPVQWNAWLTHTRSDPPSLEELQADLDRQRRVQMNAAILEARDKEERERTARLALHVKTPAPPRLDETLEWERDPSVGARSNSAPKPVGDPWAEVQRSSDEPESWIPNVRRK